MIAVAAFTAVTTILRGLLRFPGGWSLRRHVIVTIAAERRQSPVIRVRVD